MSRSVCRSLVRSRTIAAGWSRSRGPCHRRRAWVPSGKSRAKCASTLRADRESLRPAAAVRVAHRDGQSFDVGALEIETDRGILREPNRALSTEYEFVAVPYSYLRDHL